MLVSVFQLCSLTSCEIMISKSHENCLTTVKLRISSGEHRYDKLNSNISLDFIRWIFFN